MYVLNVLALFLLFNVSLGAFGRYYDLDKADEHFADFIQKFNRKYESAEEFRKRFEVFKKNLEKINTWNAKGHYEGGGFGITQFADVEKLPPCFVASKMNSSIPLTKVKREFIENAPDELDYRTSNLVTEVKNQGNCGDCYIFAAIGNIEGVHAKNTPGDLVSLSEQQVLDCFSEATCVNGVPYKAINYAAASGCETESDYPYTQVKQSCQYDASKVKVKINGAQMLETSTIEALKGALYQNGAPIVVSLEASDSFKHWYDPGVFTPTDCTGAQADHAVLLVGYGKDANGVSYWLFKNSWGTGLGDGGYYKLNMKNNCVFGQVGSCTAT